MLIGVNRNIGCKDKNPSWHLIGFPIASDIDRVNSIISGRNPPLCCTHIMYIAMLCASKYTKTERDKVAR